MRLQFYRVGETSPMFGPSNCVVCTLTKIVPQFGDVLCSIHYDEYLTKARGVTLSQFTKATIISIQRAGGIHQVSPIPLTTNGRIVLETRYLAPGETPEQRLQAVANEIARAEHLYCNELHIGDPMNHPADSCSHVREWADRFYSELLAPLKFLPNSPTLMDAGKNNGFQYSGCFVLPVEDSVEGIFETVKKAALIHRTGGGTGFSFSRIRPKGAPISTIAQGEATGPIGFLRVFDAATEAIIQGGTRRGANMGILRVDHPDIIEFINCKRDGSITNFNISVAVTNDFMDKLVNCKINTVGGSHTCSYTLHHEGSPKSLDVFACDIWNSICEAAWATGDPGLFFIDRCNEGTANPVPSLGPIESTNPCGEQPLYPYDICNLGSIDVSKFFMDTNRGINWDSLGVTVALAVRFLDDVLDVNPYPFEEIKQVATDIRRIGLGIMGLADLFIKLHIPYDSEGAVKLSEKLANFINETAHEASRVLAKEKGVFPLYPQSIHKAKSEPEIRNAAITTIAPTGTISIIAGCSSGIEPIFASRYPHRGLDGKMEEFVHPAWREYTSRFHEAKDIGMAIMDFNPREPLLNITERKYPDYLVTAHEIDPEWHIKHQAAWQRHTDNAVSKTINMPNHSIVADVDKAYRMAWDTGCTGITIFRHGSKEGVLGDIHEEESGGVHDRGTVDGALPPSNSTDLNLGSQARSQNPIERPLILNGQTIEQPTPFGDMFVTVNFDKSQYPFEVFVNIGKAGSDISAMAEGLGRAISVGLRSGVTIQTYIKQLKDIGGRAVYGIGPNQVRSLPHGVAVAIQRILNDMTPLGTPAIEWTSETLPPFDPLVERVTLEICPDCGIASIVYEEGCRKCINCGYSEC